VKQITEQAFSTIRDAYIASAQANEDIHLARARGARMGGGGEGPEHMALKKRIAADPAGVLGEPGLRFWSEEWNDLPTGDRIDVVLKDALDRFVAVEVEVDCDSTEMAGPLQCAKYRAMLSYFFDRPVEEVRSILVAHSIHPEVHARCTKYNIEVKTVARQRLEAAQ
jgi:RecB family endonuclease NucS